MYLINVLLRLICRFDIRLWPRSHSIYKIGIKKPCRTYLIVFFHGHMSIQQDHLLADFGNYSVNN